MSRSYKDSEYTRGKRKKRKSKKYDIRRLRREKLRLKNVEEWGKQKDTQEYT